MKKLIFFTLLFAFTAGGFNAYAQFGEPEVLEKEKPRNLFDEGYRTGFGFNFSLNDFGVGAGGQFRFGLNPYTEAIATLKISALKDPTEQTFIDYYFGFRTVPEKYKRILSFPLYVGLKKRFFAEDISDNFRVYSSLSAGPTYAFSYPYFNDLNDNGFRENDRLIYGFSEQVNDVFTGWKQADSHWGFGGEFVIGIDFGEKFNNLSSVQFGYTMNYFSKGIQVLEPCAPDLTRINQAPINPCGVGSSDVVQVGENAFAPLEKANDPRKYFGSAQISFIFGWMW
ncbi:hypothetical protein [Gracilimonas tropica]|uniref:hypothetical protein n=1 Tax=Gracilimonas tropica TaxID=454600 RepID=UPI00036FDF50|nr:hypothetical protein [Gracilimonas tropica]